MEKTKFYPGQTTDPYQGKVRIVSTSGNLMVTETTDRISAYDVVLPFTVPYKGAVLNLMTNHFMQATAGIVPNCLLATPTQNISIWRKTTPFKFEVIVRAYNTGSFWRNYFVDKKKMPWQYSISRKLKENAKLPEIIVTPSTKEDSKGKHDEDISFEDILAQGLATESELESIKDIALKLFAKGQEMADERGLILVDTKYEFGKDENGTIYLIDEVHTPDSSRYWYKKGYATAFKTGKPPKALSKEFVREWLKKRGFMGKEGQTMPKFSSTFISSIADRYLELYKIMIGVDFVPVLVDEEEEAYKNICASLIKVRPQVDAPKILIAMGSDSDLSIMQKAIDFLAKHAISFYVDVVSAHRTPADVIVAANAAERKRLKVIIAAAGGAAHLAGMLAASSPLPVIGVPVKSSNSMIGLDSTLSTQQMPAGVPVATMAIDGAENAAIYALQILGTSDPVIAALMKKHKAGLKIKVDVMREKMSANFASIFP